MKTRTLRNAISIALLVAVTGTGEWAMAQDITKDTTTQGKAFATDASAKGQPKKSNDKSAAPVATSLPTVTVTGTRIRGGTTPSPVITISSEQIRQEGFTDLGEVIRSVPQNFGGGQNPGVVVGATLGSGGIANQNSAGGSALNLRGLGPDATLTLLNGRRLAYGGFAQAVDISAIPVEAVDRIEIVPDGASAIYGSDAVGGVGNVILKRDYDGVTVGARYGGATEGGLATRAYNVTAGTIWSSGGLIATYKDTSTDPVYARQRNYADYMFDPTTLYPGSDLHSGLVSLHQSIGDSVELQLDAFRTRRQQDTYPHNTRLSPSYYRIAAESTTSSISPSVLIYLAGDWTLSIDGSRGRDESIQDQSRVDIATGASATVFHSCSCNDAFSYEIGAEGPLFAMPGGDARLAVGAGARRNEFVQSNDLTGTNYADGDESSRFAYAEFSLPLVGPGTAVAGIHRLELTAAVRGEDHDSFGRVTTPKLGLIYGPNDDFTLKASWGKSFKAPTLFQLYQTQNAALDPASFYGGVGYGPDATVLSVGGGNPNLDAERATTWTVSSAFHPEALPALEAELTWFDIDYTNRVVQPITDYGHALGNSKYAQFIDYSPTAQGIEGVLHSANAFYNFTGKPYDPNDVAAIMFGQYVNVARQHIKGVDLSPS
jgi:outer membrane receptor for ferrienterochelin and colicin